MPITHAPPADALLKTGGAMSGTLTVTPGAAQGISTTSDLASGSGHALTAYMRGVGGANQSAINAISDNPAMTAVQISGRETNRGTVKVKHVGYADGSDGGAAALSADLTTEIGGSSGTAAQGLFITGTTGPTTGNLVTLRNNGVDDFVVKGTGRVGVGVAIGATPAGRLEIVQRDDATPGYVIKANSTLAGNLIECKRASDGAVRTRVDAQCQFATQQTAYFTGPGLMLGSSSTDFGGGVNVVGVKNATTLPTTNPSAGGILYADGGALKWRGPSGTVTTVGAA